MNVIITIILWIIGIGIGILAGLWIARRKMKNLDKKIDKIFENQDSVKSIHNKLKEDIEKMDERGKRDNERKRRVYGEASERGFYDPYFREPEEGKSEASGREQSNKGNAVQGEHEKLNRVQDATAGQNKRNGISTDGNKSTSHGNKPNFEEDWPSFD